MKNKISIKDQFIKLRDLIKKYNKSYYNSKPDITDAEFDKLKIKYGEFLKKDPLLKKFDNIGVGTLPSSKFKKIPISGPVFSRERHIESLKKSLVLLKKLDLKEIDIAAENVRRSIMYIDGINQKFDIEKILDIIFSDFCIGK